MDSNARNFILHVQAVGVELAPQASSDGVKVVFHGNVTPGDRKRVQKAIKETLDKHGDVPMSLKRLM